jgi:hypothetical protein
LRRDLEQLESRDVPTLLGQQLFPSDNPMNQNIANAPVAANSAAIISHIGTSIKVHPDLGYDSPLNGAAPIYGIPYNVVHGNSVTKVNVIIDGYPSQSDELPVPIPANAVIEGDYQNGPNLNGPGYNSGERGDSHLIIWDEDNNMAYELFGASRPSDTSNMTGQWEALQETVWNMNTDTFRELGETSADAAGLSILAGLLRPDEALPTTQGGQGAIDHALRFTLPGNDINPQYIYPASHEISVSSQSSDLLPLGARLRLANTPQIDSLIASMGPEAQVVATAMQQYGLILADDGSPMFITGASAAVDANNDISLTWDISDILGLESLTASDFQVVNLTPSVTGLSESAGASGDTITITGQNFSGAAGHLSVFFGTTAATSVTFVSDSEITTVVPNGTGTVNVTVQSGVDETDTLSSNPDANVTAPIFGYGSSATSSADRFTYDDQTISGANSTVSFASGSDLSGQGDLVTIGVEDTNGNPVNGLSSSEFVFILGNGTSTGTFGPVSATSTPGIYTTTFTGYTAGTPSTLTLTVGGVPIVTEPTVQVMAGSVSGSESTVSFASATDNSGQTDGLTIVVADAAGNPISGLASSNFAFSLAGGTSTGNFGTVSPTGTPGIYTANFTGVLAGSADKLTLKVNAVALATQPTVTVIPGGVGGGDSTVSFATSTLASGSTETVTIVVKDAAGNPIANLANSAFVFSLAGGTSTGSFGNVAGTATPGTYTTSFLGVVAGSTSTLTTTISGVKLSSQPTIQVTAGGVGGGNSSLTLANSEVASGAVDTATIVVEDAAGNAITGLPTSAFGFSLAGGTSTGSFGPVSATTTPGVYTASFTGVVSGTASTMSLKVNGVLLATQPKVTVIPGAVSGTKSTVSFAAATDISGAGDTVAIVVKDGAGNAITGLANSAFAFNLAGGTSTGTFGTVSETTTPGTYTTTFTGVVAGTSSTLTLAVSNVSLSDKPTVQVESGAVSGQNSTVAFASPTVASGGIDAVTIVVKDADGNAISGLPTGGFAFALAGGTSTGTFSGVTPGSTPGTYNTTFTGVTMGTASTLTLKVSGVALATQPSVTVTAPLVSGSKSTVTFAAAVDASGTPDSVTIVVKNTAGAPISRLTTGDFAFNLTGGTSTGSFGTVTQTATPGTYKTTFTGLIAGTASTLNLAITGIPLASEPKVIVKSGSRSGITSTARFASPTVVSGTTDTLTLVVRDAAGNPINGFPYFSFDLSLGGGTTTGLFSAVTETALPGTYIATFTGIRAGTASTLTVKVNGVAFNEQPTVQVTPGAVGGAKSTVTVASPVVDSGATDLVTIRVRDHNLNPISGLPSSDFVLNLARGQSSATFGTVTETSTPGTYSAVLTGVRSGTASEVSVVVDGTSLVSEPTVTVKPGAVSGLLSAASLASSTVAPGQTDRVTLNVKDAAGNAITGLPNGAFQLMVLGGTSTATFGSVTPLSTPGEYTVLLKGKTAGTASDLVVAIEGVTLSTQPSIQVI